MKYDRPIHELLRECAQELREPFRAAEIVSWFRARYPDVAVSAVRAHIQAMTGNTPNREENHPFLGTRPPVLRRVSHGVYVRWSGSAVASSAPASTDRQRSAGDRPSTVTAEPWDVTSEWFWEGNVQSRLLTFLVGQGYEVIRVADTRSREAGTDVIARLGGRLLHVEVKGWPSQSYRDPEKAHLTKPTSAATQARVWFNDAVVHALRLRDAHSRDEVAMCLPDRPTYRSLLDGIAASITMCRVKVLLVGEDGACQQYAFTQSGAASEGERR